jgi:hypothetical protein
VHSPLLSARLFLLATGTERHCFMAATLSRSRFPLPAVFFYRESAS